MIVFWVVAHCSHVEVTDVSKVRCYLHHQGDNESSKHQATWHINPGDKDGCLLSYCAM